jgi:hypothetical protein
MAYTTTYLNCETVKKKVNKIKKKTTGRAPTKTNREGERDTPHQTHRTAPPKRTHTKKGMRCEPQTRPTAHKTTLPQEIYTEKEKEKKS